eukprot:SAG31_NODE_24251_length_483_cov_5.715026_1_plen_106_part_10
MLRILRPIITRAISIAAARRHQHASLAPAARCSTLGGAYVRTSSDAGLLRGAVKMVAIGSLSLLQLLLAACVASGGAAPPPAPVGDYIGTSLAGGQLTQQEQLLFE